MRNKQMRKIESKAQAAMEFLMTYGWAIILVLVVLAALAYFGVLSPENLMPEKCVLGAGIACTDFEINENSVKLALINGLGNSVTITSIDVGGCTCAASGVLGKQEQGTFTVSGCHLEPGKKIKEEINITYSGRSGLPHQIKGLISGKAKASGYASFGLDSGVDIWPQNADTVNQVRFQNMAGTGMITKMEILFGETAGGNARLGVYADNSGDPGLLLKDAGEFAVSSGWAGVDGVCLPVTEGTHYWLSFILQNADDIAYQSGMPAGEHRWENDEDITYGPLPATVPPGSSNTNKYVIRAVVVPSQT